MPYQRKQDPKKFCAYCAVRLSRKRFGKTRTLESMNIFRRRKFCSLTCAGLSRAQPGPILTKAGWHYRARKLRKEACEACGKMTSLHAHHSNGNRNENTEANIQTLCIHCHKFWHDTLSRLGLPIAGKMPALF